MTNNYSIKSILCLNALLIVSFFSFSQNKEEIKEITKNYNLEKLKELETSFQQNFFSEKLKATKLAEQNGWPVRYSDDNGTLFELKKIADNGTPIYYQTFNTAAAESTRADWMHNGGGLGLNIEGQGMTAHVWDGGLARSTHQEYDGAGGTDRHSIGDGTTALHFHAAHVTGTIMASGVSANAKGMAPQSSVVGYDWTNDVAEATTAAANGMLLSNHSYGFNAAAIPDEWFGAYGTDANEWDTLMYNTPYYLMVVAAGNDGNDNSSNAAPLSGNALYDKLSGHATAKNNMVVANGQDANINGDGTLSSVFRNTGSSEGPTDDLRIKPDIMGNGTQLFSTYQNSDTAYNSITGTSMASPNVCGSLLLLQQYYNDTNGVFMKAATLKGLALHTADDIGFTGPDSETGWGLMNTKVAAETITNNGLQSWVSEEELSQGETFTMTVQSDGTSPLLASISWTDQAGAVNTTLNDPTASLVNDLDIRVSNATTYHPWRLTDVNTNTNTTGTDNTVDPYERVDIAAGVASGTYTITVTHKGTLANGPQKFSLIMTGLSSDFTLNTQSSEQIICSSNDATFSFDYQQIGGGTTNITTSGEPAGTTTNITPSSISSNGSFDVTFGNLTAIAAGTHVIDINGDNGSESETKSVSLRIFHSDFTNYPQLLTSPTSGTATTGDQMTFTWPSNINAEDYYIEIATDPAFNTIINSSTVTDTTYTLAGLSDATVYYWRVRPNNRCSNGIFSETSNFQTGITSCNTEDNTSITNILDQDTVTSILNYPTASTIGDVNVRVNYSHTWIGDVSLTLISPNGTEVLLIDVLTCTTQTNFNFNFDDEAANTIDCDAGNANYPAVSNYQPVSSLTAFNGETANGNWTLRITDDGANDVGRVFNWSLEICELNATGVVPNFTNNGLNVDANSTYTTLVGDIEATTSGETAAQQVYTLIELPTKGDLKKNGTTMNIGDVFTQSDVNTGIITFVNTEVVAFVDQFRADIQNSVNGWLPNQIIPINGILGVSQFELGSLEIWPNPTSGNVNIKINTATNKNVSINLFDIQGRNVFNTSEKSTLGVFNTTLNFNAISNGIYLLDVQQGDRKTTKRIVIAN